jgi:hypothetical protein
MKKIISIISTSILFLSFLAIGQNCQAQESAISFSAIGGNAIAGYTNATNTGFEVSGTIADRDGFAYAKLKVSPSGLDLSGRLDPGNYSVSQSDISLDDLKAKFPEGQNTISLLAYDSFDNLIHQVDIGVIADYTLGVPALDSIYTVSPGTSDGFLKIGDSVDFSMISDEKLIVQDSKINDREMYWTEGIAGGVYTYTGRFIVRGGDRDVLLPYRFIATYQDLSGNVGETRFDLEKRIDANQPDINISSIKEGEVFKDNSVGVHFNPSETLDSYKVYLNGVVRGVKNGGTIEGLADGDYILGILGVDLAGNKVEKTVSFTIDTKVPEVNTSSELRDTYNQGDEIVLEGKTDPNSKVTVEVHSDIKYFETMSDVDGNWRLVIDTSTLGEGRHDAYLKIVDPAGNISRVLLGSFEIIISAVEEAQIQEQEPIKLARAETLAVATDVGPVIYDREAPSEEEKVAFEPRIVSSSDARNLGINWSAWLILIGLVAVSFLVAGISYYGYSQAASVASKQRASRAGGFALPSEPKPEESKEEKLQEKEESHLAKEEKKGEVSEDDDADDVEGDAEDDVQVRW